MSILIKNGTLVNEGGSFKGSLFILDDRIEQIIPDGGQFPDAEKIIEAEDMFVMPGVIDDHVHFREPGSIYKGDTESESAAAVLGGVTSYMDMPNNNPSTVTIEAIENKNAIAQAKSYANYSFYLGASDDNIHEIISANPGVICGLKVFMGSSTGNMHLHSNTSIENIFRHSLLTVAVHCEEEDIIKKNLDAAIQKYGSDQIPFCEHPLIRSREACIKSSSKAIKLALKYGTRLHILHISTEEEVKLLRDARKKSDKITGEACVHYMFLDDSMYGTLQGKMKCNPAIKRKSDRQAIIEAVKDGTIRIIGTDHAPHTLDEKIGTYLHVPSGLPMIQYSLQLMMELYKENIFTISEIVDRMIHSPAINFKISRRGFLRKGYFADIIVVDPNKAYDMSKNKPACKCGWSPFEKRIFGSSIIHTFVNGVQVVCEGKLTGEKAGYKLQFDY